MPVVTLPDGAQRRFDGTVTVAEVASSIGAGLAQRGACRQGQRQAGRYVLSIETTPTVRIVTEKDPDGARDHPPFDRAPARAGGAVGCFPEAQVTIGPVDRGRLLLRLRLQRRRSRPRTSRRSRRDAGNRHGGSQPCARRVMSRDEAVQFFTNMGEHYKAEIIAGISGGPRPISLVRPGRLGRPVPRPARAVHRQAQGLQADEGRRRLLARRFAQRDAAAHLRHRVARREGARRLPARGSKKPRSATTAASASELDLFHLQEEAPGAVFWHPKGWRIFQR